MKTATSRAGFLLALLLGLSTAIGAEPAPPARPRDAAFVILDASLSMGRSRAASRAAVYEWVSDGFHQQWKDPSWLEFWTFQERPNTSRFESTPWSNRQARALADRLLTLVDRLRFEGTGRPDLALSELNARLPRYDTVHALILTDGEAPLKGTPFDTELNWTIRRQRERVQADRRLFIVALRASHGKYEAWRVGLTGERVLLPAPPAPPPYDLAALMAPHRPSNAPATPPAQAVPALTTVVAAPPVPAQPAESPKPVATARPEATPPPAKPTPVEHPPATPPQAEPPPKPLAVPEQEVAVKQAEPPPLPPPPSAAKPRVEPPPKPAEAVPPNQPETVAVPAPVAKPSAAQAVEPTPAVATATPEVVQSSQPPPPAPAPVPPQPTPKPAPETPPASPPASPPSVPERTPAQAEQPAAAPIAPHPRLAPTIPAATVPAVAASNPPPPRAGLPTPAVVPPTTNPALPSDPYAKHLGTVTPAPAKRLDRRPIYLGLGALLLLLGAGMLRWGLQRRAPRSRSSLISRSLERPK